MNRVTSIGTLLRKAAHPRARVAAFFLAAALVVPVATAERGFSQQDMSTQSAVDLQEAFVRTAEQYRPLVVSITAKKYVGQQGPQHEFFFGDPFEFFFGEPEGPKGPEGGKGKKRYFEGGGSGVLIDPDGYILTNYHVISDANDITVQLSGDGEGGKTYDAKLVGKDPYTDLAVIKIQVHNGFKAAKLGDSDQLRVGDWVLAIGSPFGLGQTVTSGIVSAKRQTLVIEGKRYDNMIQTDAAINRGNSGGPLVNIRGEVIGINTAIYAPTGVFAGIGFAVPINRAKEIINDLIKKGKVTRGWLGVEIREVDQAVARQFGLKQAQGVLVNNVGKGSPAAKGGLQRGDVILSFAGEQIRDSAQLQGIVSRLEPGKAVDAQIVRDGKPLVLKIKPGTMPDDPDAVTFDERGAESGRADWQGVEVQGVTRELAEQYDIPQNEEGVVVVDGGLGLVEGDLIKEVNRQKTPSVAEFKRATSRLKPSDGVVFDIIRNGVPVYITYQGKR